MRDARVRRAGILAVAVGLAFVVQVRAADPLAGIVLEDAGGRSWRVDELAGAPVLLVVAERKDAAEADGWGARLAAEGLPLAPWRAPGRVTWLSVADLGRVPPWARKAAGERLGERATAASEAERRQRSPLLHDWGGAVARRLHTKRGGATVVLLSAERDVLVREHGPPTEEGLARVAREIRRAVPGA